MHMPRSRIPVVSRQLALFRLRNYCLPLHPPCRLSPLARIILSDHHLAIISGFCVAACALASPLLRTPHLRDRTSVPLLACWLCFDLAGFSPAGQHQQISMPIGTSQRFTFYLARGRRLRITRGVSQIVHRNRRPYASTGPPRSLKRVIGISIDKVCDKSRKHDR